MSAEIVVFLIAFAFQAIVTVRLYALRRLLYTSYSNNYKTIGFSESDGAYADAIKTIYGITYRMNKEGLPEKMKCELLLYGLFQPAYALAFIIAFVLPLLQSAA